MLRTDKFADLHVHTPCPDIDKSLAMFKELSDMGIKDFNIAAINYRDYPVDENIRDLYIKAKFKEANVSVFGGLYYSPYLNHFGVPFEKQAETLLQLGCDGIKLIENKPNYRKYIGYGLNSKLYDRMFDMLEEKQTPILCHAADPEEFWDRERIKKMPIGEHVISRGWMYDNDSFLTYRQIMQEISKRLDRNPKLNIVFAHFFFLGYNIDYAEEFLNKYPNLKFDLTPGWEMYEGFLQNYDRWRDFFEKYSDRIFYGTDTHLYPMNKKIHETVRYAVGGDQAEITMPHAAFAHMKGFDLSERAQKNICYDNYQRLIGKTRSVNTELLRSEAEEILKLVRANGDDRECESRLERIISEL